MVVVVGRMVVVWWFESKVVEGRNNLVWWFEIVVVVEMVEVKRLFEMKFVVGMDVMIIFLIVFEFMEGMVWFEIKEVVGVMEEVECFEILVDEGRNNVDWWFVIMVVVEIVEVEV